MDLFLECPRCFYLDRCLGVGRPPEGWDAADYVLGKFTKEEIESIDSAVLRSADAIEYWASNDVTACMNKYNASVDAN